jgi:hypothetical protein
MRRIAITLGTAALMNGGAFISGASAQIERGPAALAGQAQNFTPVEKAACGPHWGRFCGPFHHGSAAAGIAGARPADVPASLDRATPAA